MSTPPRKITTDEFVKQIEANESHIAKYFSKCGPINDPDNDIIPGLRRVGIDLSYTDLTEVNFNDERLHKPEKDKEGKEFITPYAGVGLFGANFSNAIFPENANLSGFRLYGATLDKAHLQNADLSGTDLRETSITLTDLRGVNLNSANTHGVDFSQARTDAATFKEPTIQEIIKQGAKKPAKRGDDNGKQDALIH